MKFQFGVLAILEEVLFSDDLADACIKLIKLPKDLFFKNIDPQCSHINVGTGEDITISDLASLIAKVIGFKGRIIFDQNYEDGVLRKLLDVSNLKSLGWEPKIKLELGLNIAYEDYLSQKKPDNEQ